MRAVTFLACFLLPASVSAQSAVADTLRAQLQGMGTTSPYGGAAAASVSEGEQQVAQLHEEPVGTRPPSHCHVTGDCGDSLVQWTPAPRHRPEVRVDGSAASPEQARFARDVQACALDAFDRGVAYQGELTLRYAVDEHGARTGQDAQGPQDTDLRRCVLEAVRSMPLSEHRPSATVTLRVDIGRVVPVARPSTIRLTSPRPDARDCPRRAPSASR